MFGTPAPAPPPQIRGQSAVAPGSGSGSDGKAVAYDTRDPRFKSWHQQNFAIVPIKNRNKENEE